MTHVHSVKRAAVLCAVTALALSGLTAPAASAAIPTPTVIHPGYVDDSDYSAEGLPTTQINGTAWKIQVHGNTAYVGGKFTSARPAGAARGVQETPRANMLAFDVTTGELIREFNAPTNGEVVDVAVSDDGQTVFIVGKFTTVGGQPRSGFAALDAATGAVLPLDLQISGLVTSVATRGNDLYVGGPMGSVQGVSKWSAARIDLTTGQVQPHFVHMTGPGSVRALEVSPDGTRLALGGQFDSANGTPVRGFVLLNTSDFSVVPSAIYTRIISGPTRNSGILDLDGDGRGVYAGAFNFGQGHLEGGFASDWDGNLRWVADHHGDSTGIWTSGDSVHMTGHPYMASNSEGMPQTNPETYRSMISFTNEATIDLVPLGTAMWNSAGLRAPRMQAHNPRLEWGGTQTQSAWAVDGNPDYMVVGGEFPRVNGVAQEGLVRFARRDVPGSQQFPHWGSLGIDVTSRGRGEVQVLVTPTNDRDDAVMTYQIRRAGKVLDERTIRSSDWAVSDYAIVDKLPEGESATYWVWVYDSDGNLTAKQSANISAAPGTTTNSGLDTYRKAVAEDGVRWFFEPGAVGEDTLRSGSGLRTTSGGLMGDAFSLTGTSYSYGVSTERVRANTTFSTEAWIKVPRSFTSGAIMSFGASTGTTTSSRDRMLYLTTDGRLALGTTPHAASVQVVRTPQAINDNQWHHVVATKDGAGVMTIYVDGQAAVQERKVVGGGDYWGYWRIGAQATSGFTYSSGRFASATATLDAPAVYHGALTAEQVARHYELGLDADRPETVEPEVPVDPPANPLDIIDTFERTVVSGWGAAEAGGDWTAWGASVADGKGLLTTQPRGGAGAQSSVLLVNAGTEVTVGLDAAPTGPMYLTLAQRRGEGYQYEAKVTVRADGSALVGLNVLTPEGTTYLGTKLVDGVTLGGGQTMQLRLETVSNGQGGTDLRVYAWPTGSERPTDALVSATDTTEQLQDAGQVRFETYLSGAATAPVTVSVDNWRTTTIGN